MLAFCVLANVYIVQICIIDGALSMFSKRGYVPDIRPRECIKKYCPLGRGGRYVLIIHFYVESGQKMIQFNIQFKIESKIFIQ